MLSCAGSKSSTVCSTLRLLSISLALSFLSSLVWPFYLALMERVLRTNLTMCLKNFLFLSFSWSFINWLKSLFWSKDASFWVCIVEAIKSLASILLIPLYWKLCIALACSRWAYIYFWVSFLPLTFLEGDKSVVLNRFPTSIGDLSLPREFCLALRIIFSRIYEILVVFYSIRGVVLSNAYAISENSRPPFSLD